MTPAEIKEKILFLHKTISSCSLSDFLEMSKTIKEFKKFDNSFLNQLPTVTAIDVLVIFGLFMSASLVFQPSTNKRMEINLLSKSYLDRARRELMCIENEKEAYGEEIIKVIKDRKNAISVGSMVIKFFNIYDNYANKVMMQIKFKQKKNVNKVKDTLKSQKLAYNSYINKEKIESLVDDKEKIESLINGLNQAIEELIAETGDEIFAPTCDSLIHRLMDAQFACLTKTIKDYFIPFFDRSYRHLIAVDNLALLSQSSLIKIKTLSDIIVYILTKFRDAEQLGQENKISFNECFASCYINIKIDDFKDIVKILEQQIKLNTFRGSNLYKELMETEKYKRQRLSKSKVKFIPTSKPSKPANISKENKSNKKDKSNKPYSIADDAFANFSGGNFSKAIALYTQQLNTIQQDDLLRANILICIGQCYFYWNKSIAKMSSTLQSKSQENFSLAAKLIVQGMANKENKYSEEWKVLSELHNDLLAIFSTQSQPLAEITFLDKTELSNGSNYIHYLSETGKLLETKNENEIFFVSYLKKILTQKTQDIFEEYIKRGHSLYIVGGFLRAFLSEGDAKDCDVVTSASPNESKEIIGEGAYLISRNHPIVRWKNANEQLDICSFQGASIKKVVTFDNDMSYLLPFGRGIEEDFQSRDITINALYFDLKKKVFVDPTAYARKDLQNKCIRMINSKPSESFKQDSIRILRVLRFETSLGFAIESKTQKALLESIPLLREAPAARILLELHKIFMMTKGGEILKKLDDIGVMSVLFIKNKYDSNKSFFNKKLLYAVLNEFSEPCISDESAWIVILIAVLFPSIEKINLNLETVQKLINDIIQNNIKYFDIKTLNLGKKFENIILGFYFPNTHRAELVADEKKILYKLIGWSTSFMPNNRFGFFEPKLSSPILYADKIETALLSALPSI